MSDQGWGILLLALTNGLVGFAIGWIGGLAEGRAERKKD